MYETIIKNGMEYKLVPIKPEKKNRVLFTLSMPRNNEVLDYILKRYHTNRIKYRSQRSTIAETDYAKHAIIELRKILKHFNVKYKAL